MSPSRRRLLAVLTTTTATLVATLAGALTPATAATTAGPKVPGAQPCCGSAFLTPGRSLWQPGPDHPAEAALVSIGLAATANSPAATTQLGAYLVLQSDGNLVEYAQPSHQVLFTTHTHTAVRLDFQTDHNVVLRDAAGRALWATGSQNTDAAYFGPYGNGELVTQRANGDIVTRVGTAMTPAPGVVVADSSSPDGRFWLSVQGDGNLVEYERGSGGRVVPVWNSHTAGAGAVRLAAQSDGNLVLYSLTTGRAVWASRTATAGSAYHQLDTQDDGNVVLYRTDGVRRLQAVWSTGVHA